jgi:hypothetical protein
VNFFILIIVLSFYALRKKDRTTTALEPSVREAAGRDGDPINSLCALMFERTLRFRDALYANKRHLSSLSLSKRHF